MQPPITPFEDPEPPASPNWDEPAAPSTSPQWDQPAASTPSTSPQWDEPAASTRAPGSIHRLRPPTNGRRRRHLMRAGRKRDRFEYAISAAARQSADQSQGLGGRFAYLRYFELPMLFLGFDRARRPSSWDSLPRKMPIKIRCYTPAGAGHRRNNQRYRRLYSRSCLDRTADFLWYSREPGPVGR